MGHRIQRMENMVNAVNGGPGQNIVAKIKAGKQERAEKRTRKSELISEHGRKTGKQLHKVEHASDRQKQKAQERTKASEEMSAKGIEMNKRGYAKRRTTDTHFGYHKNKDPLYKSDTNPKGLMDEKMRWTKTTIKRDKYGEEKKRKIKTTDITRDLRKYGNDTYGGKMKVTREKITPKTKAAAARTEKLESQGIEVTKRGHAKRRTIGASGGILTGDYKKTKTIRDKSGNVKRTKTATQITPVQKSGVGEGNYTAKVEKTGKETKYKTKNINPGSKAVRNVALGAIGVLGVNTFRSHLKI